MRTPPARGEDQTGKKKFFTNSSPDKQKDLILKALHTAPDQTNLFQTSSSLDFFMSSLNVCLPLPRVLCATGCWCTFMVSTWCMNSGPFLLLETKLQTFLTLIDSTLLPFNPPLLNFVHVYCSHFCHQRFAKFWNFFLSLQKACSTP